jgi:hypothetical protein
VYFPRAFPARFSRALFYAAMRLRCSAGKDSAGAESRTLSSIPSSFNPGVSYCVSVLQLDPCLAYLIGWRPAAIQHQDAVSIHRQEETEPAKPHSAHQDGKTLSSSYGIQNPAPAGWLCLPGARVHHRPQSLIWILQCATTAWTTTAETVKIRGPHQVDKRTVGVRQSTSQI